MAKTTPLPVRVNTTVLLAKAQRAWKEASLKGDKQLAGAAESVMSALMVVAKFDAAALPGDIRPFIDIVEKWHGTNNAR